VQVTERSKHQGGLALEERAESSRRVSSSESRSRSRTFFIISLVILLNTLGNLTLTWGLRHVAERLGANPLDYMRAMLNPFVTAGISMLILWLLTRMALMSWADLSFLLPVTAIGYVLNEVLAHSVLHEQISRQRWVGTALIFAGALLVGSTTPRNMEAEAE
jgi:uncharacterized membrane protein